MKFRSTIIATLLAGGSLARNLHAARQDAPATVPVPVPAPAPVPPQPAPPVGGGGSGSGSTGSSGPVPLPAVPGGSGGGPNCGKGYAYCGYMLTANGHNFPPEAVSKAYCDGLSDHCAGDSSKTDASQAVFVCLDDEPNSSIQLLCACAGKCLNDPETNNIAHCDSACYN